MGGGSLAESIYMDGDGSGAGSVRVLIADDHEGIRQMLALRLQTPWCVVVAQATNGREAVDQTIEFAPDVVVMDVAMPLMDGIEATREIKKRFPRIDILGYTAISDAGMVHDLIQAGASENFFKDNYVGLIEAIEAHVGS
jgi:DNA-binding NarL/FixJ family response regulator